MPRAVTVMRSIPLRPLLVAVLCVLLGASGTLAAEPTPAPAPAATPEGTPAPGATPEPGAGAAPEATPTPDTTPAPEATAAPGATGAPEATATPPSPEETAPPGATPAPDAPPGPAALPSPTEATDADADGRVIVILRSNVDPAAAASRARALGARVERTFGRAIHGYAAQVSPDELRRLEADPRVETVVPDVRIEAEEALAAQAVPNGVRRIYGNKSAAARIDGADQRVDADVAIFDTGIDPTHPDLAVAGGYNCTTSNRSNWIDEEGHGTHVAGTVGALDNGSGVVGVAPGVRLWAVRILDSKGEGYLSWWICGLDWIAGQVDPADPSRPLIEAVNMSVTRWGSDDGNCGNTNDDVLHRAICRVVARGITVVVAAANDSASATHRVPAAYNEVITVSALADTDGKPGALGGSLCWSWGGYDKDDTFADFSNYGHDIDLIAPGKCTYSTMRGQTYGYSSGTSMAAPHVTGAAALYLASRPGASPSEVRWALRYLGNTNWRTSTDPDGSPDILLDVSRIGPLGTFSPSATLPAGGLLANEAGGAWTVPVSAGRGTNFIEPLTFGVASVEAPVTASMAGATSLSGSASSTAVTISVPRATPAGTYDVVVRGTYRALRVRDVRISVVVENEPPVAEAPVASLTGGVRASLTGVPLRLAWAAAADQSAIVRYEIGEGATSFALQSVARTGGSTRSATRTIPFATSRAHAIRATDAPGNVGAWAAAPPRRVSVVQETGSGVTRSSGWTGYRSSAALGGRFVYADRAGSWVRFSFKGSGVALVGRKGPSRGRAEIRVDGVRVATVDAHARSLGTRWVLFARAVDPARTHTVEVRVLGTAGHPRFDVDAFLVLR
jgi:subtilisin